MKTELKLYSSKYFAGLRDFYLPEEQLQFTALPSDMLEATNEKHPIVIACEEQPVGFFVLHSSSRVQEYTDNSDGMLLTAFSINYPEQGKGYASDGLKQLRLLTLNQFPSCNEIVLAVNKRNIPAQKLYIKSGFQDTGRRKMGSIGEQLIMSKNV
ncbi:GNAT family N-acetyltransferase [Fictibacillus aquaticus]|uniref:GNAT family N-acetyltransferase n=2 Tax=Fictibacillus aquaticus TaxID=2021314 RepID=A0A235FFS9_9BACL|nr:GNAT family N-acetyltransferase [Fictibacillus aquaticus]